MSYTPALRPLKVALYVCPVVRVPVINVFVSINKNMIFPWVNVSTACIEAVTVIDDGYVTGVYNNGTLDATILTSLFLLTDKNTF